MEQMYFEWNQQYRLAVIRVKREFQLMIEGKDQIGRNDDGRGEIFCVGGSLKGSQRSQRSRTVAGTRALQSEPAKNAVRGIA